MSQGMNGRQIGIALGLTKGTVSYHVGNIKAETGERTTIRRYDYQIIQNLLDSGMPAREVAKRLRISRDALTRGFSAGKLTRPKRERDLSLDEYLTIYDGVKLNSDQTRIIREKLCQERGWELKCLWCGNDEWLGKPITLALDHIDGDPTSNIVSNFRFLCLNCHAQTETYGWRNLPRNKCRTKTGVVPQTGFEPAPACVKDRCTSSIRLGAIK